MAIVATSGTATIGTVIAQVPNDQRQPAFTKNPSPIIDPKYNAGMVVIDSGRVDQIALLTRVVASAMKTCCVSTKLVDPIESKSPATWYFSDMCLKFNVECYTYDVVSNVLASGVYNVADGLERNGEDKHFGSAQHLQWGEMFVRVRYDR